VSIIILIAVGVLKDSEVSANPPQPTQRIAGKLQSQTDTEKSFLVSMLLRLLKNC